MRFFSLTELEIPWEASGNPDKFSLKNSGASRIMGLYHK